MESHNEEQHVDPSPPMWHFSVQHHAETKTHCREPHVNVAITKKESSFLELQGSSETLGDHHQQQRQQEQHELKSKNYICFWKIDLIRVEIWI